MTVIAGIVMHAAEYLIPVLMAIAISLAGVVLPGYHKNY